MKKIYLITTLALLFFCRPACAQNGNDTIVYLLTCNPGTEIHTIYGHSALRIVDNYSGSDMVYHWGVFDFSTPNFAWKFAKGRLDYMVGGWTINGFLLAYFYEEIGVKSQRINLEPESVRKLLELIKENLKPENVKYKYDFFYDNCATRIRDILEKATDGKIEYPYDVTPDALTLRDMINEYQKPYLWLNFGINLAVGSPSDKKASFRERMFLPLELQKCLSETMIFTDGRIVPLLQNPTTLLDYDMPVVKSSKLFAPETILALFLILLIVFIPFIRKKALINSVDIFIFFVFSVLACFMLFFNFFTDHQATKMNLNIIWLNPFIIFCLISLIINKSSAIWFRLVFYLSILFMVTSLILPQDFAAAVIPACLILALRSSARSAFAWNPFTINDKNFI